MTPVWCGEKEQCDKSCHCQHEPAYYQIVKNNPLVQNLPVDYNPICLLDNHFLQTSAVCQQSFPGMAWAGSLIRGWLFRD